MKWIFLLLLLGGVGGYYFHREYQENTLLSQQIELLGNSKKRLSNLLSEKDAEITKINDKWQEKQNKLSKDIGELRNLLKVKEQEVMSLQDQASNQKNELNQLKEQLKSADTQNFDLEETKKQLTLVQQQKEAASEKISLLENEINLLTQAKKAKQDEINRLAKAMESIKEDGMTINQTAEHLGISVLDKILFESGSAVITPAGEMILRKSAEVITKSKNMFVKVVGHTDNLPIGKTLKRFFSSNWHLSSARSMAVIHFFIDNNLIPANRLELIAQSANKPIADNATEHGRSQNRRVEILIVPQNQEHTISH